MLARYGKNMDKPLRMKKYSYHYSGNMTSQRGGITLPINGILIISQKILCPYTYSLAKDQIRENQHAKSVYIKSLTFIGESKERKRRKFARRKV